MKPLEVRVPHRLREFFLLYAEAFFPPQVPKPPVSSHVGPRRFRVSNPTPGFPLAGAGSCESVLVPLDHHEIKLKNVFL